MFWQSRWDAPGNESAIHNVAALLAGVDGLGLDSAPNLLDYPDSLYDNVRNGMPDSPPATSSVAVATSLTTQSNSRLTSISSAPSSRALTPSVDMSASSPEPTASCSAATCNTYQARQCPQGTCSCALDASNQAVCIVHSLCKDSAVCSTNLDCGNDGMACVVDNCCDGGRCLYLTGGCLDSPRCKRYDGGWGLGDGFGLLNTGTLLGC